MTVHTLQMNMTRGEVTPFVHARVDTDHFAAGLKKCRNFMVTRYGGLTRIPGTIHLGSTKTAADKGRWISFKFNREEVYGIEVGNLYFRFWTVDGQVTSGGSPYEVSTPYLLADLKYLQWRQAGDVLYITCKGYRPKTLTRNSETSWTLADYTPLDGPYLEANTTATTMTPAATGSVVPIMTSNTAPSGTAAASTVNAEAFEVFDAVKNTTWKDGTINEGWISYDFAGTATKVVDAYWIRASSNSDPSATPVAWEFQGYDGTNWVTLDARQGETGFTRGEVRYYEFLNETGFQSYRLKWSGTDFSGNDESSVGDMGWHEAGDTQTPFNLTASSTTGINDGAGFKTSDVDRAIRLMGSDGKWRWAKIVARSSSTVVTVRLYGHSLPDLTPITNWRMGAWSDDTGWPAAVGMYEDRLVFARTDQDPLGGWATVSADYDNFRVSDPVVDDDAVSFRLTGGELNEILWIADDRDIVLGTAGSVRAVGRNDQNKAFGPGNVRQRPESIVPTSIAPPVAIENMLLFLDAYGKRLYESAYTYEIDGYLARELSSLQEHLYALGVERLHYQAYPHRLLWGVTVDGDLVAATYDREQKVFGAGLAEIGGDVDDVLSLPGDDGDELLIMVRRVINGTERRFVEKLAEFYVEDRSILGMPVYGDSAVVYDGVTTTTVTGCSHLNGQECGVWADGVDIGDATPSAGSVTLPNSTSATQVVIGLRRRSWGTTLRTPEWGQRDGNGLGRKMRVIEARVDLFETPHLEFSLGDGDTDEVRHEDDVELDPTEARPLRIGMFKVPVEGGWETGGELTFETDRMYPATIRAISLMVEGEP